jgi:ASC-1-like (ASCH) protein
MATHELKTFPQYFAQIWSGRKTCEIRLNDRGYAPDDILILKEFSCIHGYSGIEIKARCTHVLTSDDFVGLTEGYAALSIKVLEVRGSNDD